MEEEELQRKLRERPPKPKRFYKEVAVGEAGEGGKAGWRVLLDGRAVLTPMRQPMTLPSSALAEGVAAEWQAQEREIDAVSMPLTALACTALDRAGPQRSELESQLAAYGGNDLVCYWAEHPEPLVARQRSLWQPLLDWCRMRYDAELEVCQGILHREQPERSRAALAGAVAALDPFRLAALSSAVGVSGSLVIGLALIEERLDAEGAFDAAELDASYQIELWGEDSDASARRAAVRRDLEAVSQFLHLLK